MSRCLATVMVVDDSQTVVDTMSECLWRDGYETIRLLDPRRVETMLEEFRIDLILLALEMTDAGVDGYREVALKLRNEGIRTPIVFGTTSSIFPRLTYLNDDRSLFAILEKPLYEKLPVVLDRLLKLSGFVCIASDSGTGMFLSDDDRYCYKNNCQIALLFQDKNVLSALKDAFENRKYRVHAMCSIQEFQEYAAGHNGGHCISIVNSNALQHTDVNVLMQPVKDSLFRWDMFFVSSDPNERHLMEELISRFKFNGSVQWLQKPIHLPTLADTVDQLALEKGSLVKRE